MATGATRLMELLLLHYSESHQNTLEEYILTPFAAINMAFGSDSMGIVSMLFKWPNAYAMEFVFRIRFVEKDTRQPYETRIPAL